MKRFAQITYLSESNAAHFFKVKDERGVEAALDYLVEYDYGDNYDVRDEDTRGTSDESYTKGNYILSWSYRFDYCSLQKIIED